MGWEDDDDMFSDDMFEEEKTDLGEEVSSIPNQALTYQVSTTAPQSHRQNNGHQKQNHRPKGRRVKVKPMPSVFLQKFPDLVSCLFTLSSGKQVLYVKG